MGILRDTVIQFESLEIDYFHFDIMDGQFVPNFTMGSDMIKSLRDYSNKPFDVHLMVENPEHFIDLFAEAGSDMITVHAEATPHLHKTLTYIRERGLKAGVALNPSTPLSVLEYILDATDYVTIMTVNPGFAGQTFIPAMYNKIKRLDDLISKYGYSIEIQVDGNISFETIPGVVRNGATMLVCGTSSLFLKNIDLEDAVNRIHQFTCKL